MAHTPFSEELCVPTSCATPLEIESCFYVVQVCAAQSLRAACGNSPPCSPPESSSHLPLALYLAWAFHLPSTKALRPPLAMGFRALPAGSKRAAAGTPAACNDCSK
ncbi:unnamed protein product [Polarella glacialis]|uniref:Uncharacterized protein n=1 Tax=Polarella glacialis TaxID=89957 RepID=A0A813EEV5_POLGL|nr:unnamed protein product [Polarella glacialis]